MTAFTSDLTATLTFTGSITKQTNRALAATLTTKGWHYGSVYWRNAAAYFYENAGLDFPVGLVSYGFAYDYENVVAQQGDGLPTAVGVASTTSTRFQKILNE